MIGWYKLHPHIEKLGTVVVYDRPGVGDSPRAAAPQTGKAAVETLRKLLRQIGVKPPYVLVGHSFGGLHANLFARLHPGEVAGVVFLEATAPEDIGMMKQHQSTLARAVNRLLNLFSSPDPDDEVSVERETVEVGLKDFNLMRLAPARSGGPSTGKRSVVRLPNAGHTGARRQGPRIPDVRDTN